MQGHGTSLGDKTSQNSGVKSGDPRKHCLHVLYIWISNVRLIKLLCSLPQSSCHGLAIAQRLALLSFFFSVADGGCSVEGKIHHVN